MNPEDWRRKNSAWLHDPPLKHDAAYYHGKGERGHAAFGRRLGEFLAPPDDEAKEDYDAKDADHWSASADRPQLGHGGMVFVHWRSQGLVTHPLDDAPLRVLPTDRQPVAPKKILEHVQQRARTLVDAAQVTGRDGDERTCFYALWRGLEDHLAAVPPDGVSPYVWKRYVQLHPADTRCPDHSLRDHVRVASSLATLGGRDPWLFRFSIGPVGAWLAQTRSTRDLWTASFLLSELSFAAMEVVITRYGPDAVVYPDLAFNARMDRHLDGCEQLRAVLPEGVSGHRTRAALIPNSWLAIVPECSGTDRVEELGEACRRAALRRWTDIAGAVRDGFLRAYGASFADQAEALKSRWTAQCEHEVELRAWYAAIPWRPAMPAAAAPPPDRRALPAMTLSAPAQEYLDRRERFAPLVPEGDLNRYARVAWTWQTTIRTAGWGQRCGRGMDYAPTVHLLGQVLKSRKLSPQGPEQPGGGTTMCTVCGQRDALGGSTSGHIDQRRRDAQKLWTAVSEAMRDDNPGMERLCGACATRRFFVPPWTLDRAPFDPRWPLSSSHGVWADTDDVKNDRLRLPMPSTAAVAAAPWLSRVYGSADPELGRNKRSVVDAGAAGHWPPTFFARSLPAVDRVADPKDPFTELEPQWLHAGPRAAALKVLQAEAQLSASAERTLDQAVKSIRDQAKKLGLGEPSTRFAVIALDGDKLGDLLLAKPERIGVAWRSVLHPAAVAQIESKAGAGGEWAMAWRKLLDNTRTAGPSLHAFISRAVTTFANLLVPWVVEREHHGRLVYAGGDDVLALAPAEDALSIAARLQQLWSAAWIVDTTPGCSAFKRPQKGESLDACRDRFHVLVAEPGAVIDPDAPRAATHAGTGEIPAGVTTAGRIIPMLGRHQSISAGIAYGHHKTPLGLLVGEARHALHAIAKEGAGRGAVAEVLYTRGGPKVRSVFQWHGHSGAPQDMVAVARRLRLAFKLKKIPGRLPYKLALAAPIARDLVNDAELRGRWVRGSLKRALQGEGDGALQEDLASLWTEGLRHDAGMRDEGADLRLSLRADPRSVPGLGNLQLCRALAREDEDA